MIIIKIVKKVILGLENCERAVNFAIRASSGMENETALRASAGTYRLRVLVSHASNNSFQTSEMKTCSIKAKSTAI
jgi:hypothetical protein